MDTFDSKIVEEVQKFTTNPELFERMNKPMKKLYVDLNAIFDYPLTALMLLIQDQDQWEYVHSRWIDYAKYKGDDITRVFPDLGVSGDHLYGYLRDPKHSEKIAFNGLLTTLSNMIPAQLAFFKQLNSNSPLNDEQPYQICFTNEYFRLPEQAAKNIHSSLVRLLPETVMSFKYGPINQDSGRLAGSDTIILSDIRSFIQPNTPSYTMLYKDRVFSNSCIVSDYRLDEDSPYLVESLKETIENTEKVMCASSYFYFLDRVPLFLLKESEVIHE